MLLRPSEAPLICLFENAYLGWMRARPQPEEARCGPRSIGRGKFPPSGSVPEGSGERGVGHGSPLVARSGGRDRSPAVNRRMVLNTIRQLARTECGWPGPLASCGTNLRASVVCRR
jgi:hypothetical protein